MNVLPRIIYSLLCLFILFTQHAVAVEPLPPLPAFATTSAQLNEEFIIGQVVEVIADGTVKDAGITRDFQRVRIEITNGTEKGKEVVVEYGGSILISPEAKLTVNDLVVVQRLQTGDGVSYIIADRFRLRELFFFVALFLFVILLLSRWKGFGSIVGLGISVGVLGWFLIPALVSGGNPLIVSLVAALLISVSSIFFAHGFTVKTIVALISTIIALCLSVFFAHVIVTMMHLSGAGSEEALFLQSGVLSGINLRGLLLGGIVIGTLGVLDDITTAQVATIFALHQTDPKLRIKKLYERGLTVGREHIAALVNTLALAYVGVSLPLFLLFYTNRTEPFWVTLNTEYIVEEIVRTLVGSLTLVVAVPISTFLAAWYCSEHKIVHK